MTTWRHVISLVLDELKITSDDSFFNEQHILFVVNKYRTFLLQQKYGNDLKKQIPQANYQVICCKLEEVPQIDGRITDECTYIRTIDEIPQLMNIGQKRVYSDYYTGEITMISKDRMRYVGHNKYLTNHIWCSVNPNNHLYFKSLNPQHKYLKLVKIYAIFADALKAWEFRCEDDVLDVIDSEIPIQDDLISGLIEMAVNELRPPIREPNDIENNAKDDKSND